MTSYLTNRDEMVTEDLGSRGKSATLFWEKINNVIFLALIKTLSMPCVRLESTGITTRPREGTYGQKEWTQMSSVCARPCMCRGI